VTRKVVGVLVRFRAAQSKCWQGLSLELVVLIEARAAQE
jgi:hypothetical protein